MKEWKDPEIWVLGAEQTQQGVNGGDSDDVLYQVPGVGKMYGTSGEVGPPGGTVVNRPK